MKMVQELTVDINHWLNGMNTQLQLLQKKTGQEAWDATQKIVDQLNENGVKVTMPE